MLSDLEAKLTEVTNQLAQLESTKNNIKEQIKNIKEDSYSKVFQDWNIKRGMSVVMFPKNPLCWKAIKTILVNEINEQDLYIKSHVGTYMYARSNLVYTICSEYIPFSSLIEFQDNYKIYVVSQDQLQLIQKNLFSLKVTADDVESFEDFYAVKQAIRRIS